MDDTKQQLKKIKFKGKITRKIEEKVDLKKLFFRIFDEPRPAYIAKVTIVDRCIDVIILWAIPNTVRPNYVTLFRFISVPVLVWLFVKEFYATTFILFTISAISDAVDGAMARTRNQITDWGIVFDPIADKLLIGVMGGILIYQFLSPTLSFTIIFLELLLAASAYYRFKGKVVPAKTVGKIKMILESCGVGFIFLFMLSGIGIFLACAAYTFYLAIIFAVLSLVMYRSI